MTDDLLKAFFERDLNPRELEAVERALDSEADCLRFAALAAQSYAVLNLPHPRIPGKFTGGFGAISTGLVLAGIVTAKLWFSAPPAGKPAPEMLSVIPRGIAEPAKKPASTHRLATHSPGLLSLAADMKEQGLVTVRVLDEGGKEVRLLYAGMLEKGRRIFTWDGNAEGGKPAPSGTYKIEMQSGKLVDFKFIRLSRE